jgi:hypothetical protein
MSEHFETAQDAMSYMHRHDEEVKHLSRMSMPGLRALLAIEHANHRITVIEGGPVSRDELTADILALRWPHIAEARECYAEASAAYREAVRTGMGAEYAGLMNPGPNGQEPS